MPQSASFRRSRSPRPPSNGQSNGRSRSGPTRMQVFDSNGPDIRVRGNAVQIFEKYVSLARDATSSGNRINAESLYQHAEHYYRISQDAMPGQAPVAQQSCDVEPNQSNGAEELVVAQEVVDAQPSTPTPQPTRSTNPTPSNGPRRSSGRGGQPANGRSRGRGLRYPPMAANPHSED